MVRITVTSLALLVLLALPGPARAAGCEVLDDLRDRAECAARAEARAAARDEVERQVGGASGDVPAPARSAAWERALEDADGVDAGALLEPRPLAAVGGLAWFLLVLRSRRRRASTRA